MYSRYSGSISVTITFAVLMLATSEARAEEERMSVSDLASVVGMLGQPLGTVVTIEGVVVEDDYRRMKEDQGKTLLKVEKVDGVVLEGEVILSLTQYAWTSPFLFEPGKRFELVGYESGGFTGIPEEAFDHIPQVTTTGFGFEVWFQLVKVVK